MQTRGYCSFARLGLLLMRKCSITNWWHREVCHRCRAPRPGKTLTAHTDAPALTSTESSSTGRATTKFVNSGDNDATGDANPSHMLLARGLDSTTSEEVFAKGMAKLYKGIDLSSSRNISKQPAKVMSTTSTANVGAQQDSLKRVLLIRNRETRESLRYGFAEFHTLNVWVCPL